MGMRKHVLGGKVDETILLHICFNSSRARIIHPSSCGCVGHVAQLDIVHAVQDLRLKMVRTSEGEGSRKMYEHTANKHVLDWRRRRESGVEMSTALHENLLVNEWMLAFALHNK